MSRPALPEAFLFLRRVDASSGKCWHWTGGRDEDGYGRMKLMGRRRRAHRVAYELFIGPIPAGLLVCHDCDTPSCVNPDHLFTGTALDNSKDCVRKGRIAKGDRCGARLYPERLTRGETVNTAKLTPSLVLDVRERAAQGELLTSIGRSYGISHVTVSKIARGASWKHVGGSIRREGMTHRERGLRAARTP